MLILGFIVVFYIISVVLFSLIIYFILLSFYLKHSELLNELGVDKLLLLNPFFFPVKRARKIIKEKIDEKQLIYISMVSFYKLYTLIGCIICIPCIYFLSNSSIGL